MKIIFIGDAEDFHVVDKFNQSTEILKDKEVHLYSGISIEKNDTGSSVTNDENVIKYDWSYLLITNLMRNSQSVKNLIKALIYPIQVVLLKLYKRRNPEAIFHAFTMYYAVLCYFSGLKCVVTPQGSEVLQRIDKSAIYRFLAIKGLGYAKNVIVDSEQMQTKLASHGIVSLVFKNGFQVKKITEEANKVINKDLTVSIRGFNPHYDIDKILDARDALLCPIGIHFIYPSADLAYKDRLALRFLDVDKDIGTLDRQSFYKFLVRSKLVISIPRTDSSPRSVYESIFAGAAVAVTKSSYLEELPSCMLKRIIVVDLEKNDWMASALSLADNIISQPYIPSKEAFDMCDSSATILKISNTFYG